MEPIIQVENLKKYYGEVKAVDGIDFHVEEGQLFAFLGPNGAGKSTTIDIICTLLNPDSGRVRVNGQELGEDDYAIKASIGVVFQKGLLDNLLTVKENLEVRGSFYGLTRLERDQAMEEAIKATGVIEFLNRPYGKLSGGQRRRADIARALMNRPKILFLDEPTTGLDPQTRSNVWETIRKLQKETGMTIFLTTHYMEEAAAADYVVVIDKGKVAAEGTPEQLKEKYSTDKLVLHALDSVAIAGYLRQKNMPFEQKGTTFQVPLKKTLEAIPLLNACAPYLEHFEVLMGSMDDAFIGITGKEIRT
ncbi:ATP-binding cassette domain-containing protein [Jeotgalibaca sp. A122]|uniref:ATP-binding cassette domain-containing protein n=1 Tax=Jeotgalibaca sp. A122 TaxID=3457322 RepID=UPI003FD649BB